MTASIEEMIARLEEWVIDELIQVYPAYCEEKKLSRFFDKISYQLKNMALIAH